MWTRQCDKFIKLDDRGDTVPENVADKCTFVLGNDCPLKLEQCINSGDCEDFLSLKFDTVTGIVSVKDSVAKINPMTAFNLLEKLGFGSYLDDAQPGKMRLYKMQSVSSWSYQLFNDCNSGGCQSLANTVKLDVRNKLLKLVTHNKAFITYLEVLVEWVNSNTTVLNPDQYDIPINQGMPTQGHYSAFSHVEPRRKIVLDAHQDYCNITRSLTNIAFTNLHSYNQSGGNKEYVKSLADKVLSRADESKVTYDRNDIDSQMNKLDTCHESMTCQELSSLLAKLNDINRSTIKNEK